MRNLFADVADAFELGGEYLPPQENIVEVVHRRLSAVITDALPYALERLDTYDNSFDKEVFSENIIMSEEAHPAAALAVNPDVAFIESSKPADPQEVLRQRTGITPSEEARMEVTALAGADQDQAASAAVVQTAADEISDDERARQEEVARWSAMAQEMAVSGTIPLRR